jgi:phosphotransferase system HPr (HPr) family protein
MPRVVRATVLSNEHGLHARPINKLLEVTRRFTAAVTIRCGARRANGRKMFEMLMLAAPCGTEIEFDADGEDAAALVEALVAVVDSRFGELAPG